MTNPTDPNPSGRTPRALIVTVVLFPVVLAAMALVFRGDPKGGLDEAPAAIVNLDQPVTVTGEDGTDQTVAAGRQVAAELTTQSEDNLTWQLTDEHDAAEGLTEGRFHAVLTVPEDFSADVTSVSGENPQQADLLVETDPANGDLADDVASSVTAATDASLGTTVTEQYLDTVYVGFNVIHDQMVTASEGADEIATGADQVAQGATRADVGAHDLAAGIGELDSAIADLASGTATLATASGELAAGAASVSAGAGELAVGAGNLASGLGELSGQVAKLPLQTDSLASGVGWVAEGATAVDGAAREVAANSASMTQGATEVAAGAAELSAGLAQLAAACGPPVAAPEYCVQVQGAADQSAVLAEGAAGVSAGAAQVQSSTDLLAGATADLAAGAAEVSDGAGALAEGTPSLVAGVANAYDASARLVTGSEELLAGATVVASGADQSATAASQIDDGVGQIGVGVGDAHAGADQLAVGTAEVSAGSVELAVGASDLADGLRDGSVAVPTYDDATRDASATVVADPITTHGANSREVDENGQLITPMVITFALWLGAMAMTSIRRPTSGRDLRSTVPSWRIALREQIPAAGVAAAQAIALMFVVLVVIGVDASAPFLATVLAILAALAFAVTHRGLTALWGRAGLIASMLLFSVQALSLGMLVPAETLPDVLAALRPLWPATHVADSLSASIVGGEAAVATTVLILLASGFTGVAAGAVAVRRRRLLHVRPGRPNAGTQPAVAVGRPA